MNNNRRHFEVDENKLGYEFYMRHITLTLRFASDRKLEEYGITGAQGRLLGIIDEGLKDKVEISRKLLEDIMHLKGPSITSLLNGLEKNGFIKRNSSAKDGRAMIIEITQKGKTIIEDMRNIFAQTEQNLVKGMNKEEKEIFKKLLIKAYENISK
jgi:DNA-binding MarR family transcriptional regulator